MTDIKTNNQQENFKESFEKLYNEFFEKQQEFIKKIESGFKSITDFWIAKGELKIAAINALQYFNAGDTEFKVKYMMEMSILDKFLVLDNLGFNGR